MFDNGPIHTSKTSTAALAPRSRISVEWLARDASELDDSD
jgi:hypothetical protein